MEEGKGGRPDKTNQVVVEAAAGLYPQEFVCPISLTLLRDPVIAMDGHTYEREAIEQWFKTGKATSPLTNKVLSSHTVVPNHTLRRCMETLMKEYVPKQQAAEKETESLKQKVAKLEEIVDAVEADEDKGVRLALARLKNVEDALTLLRTEVRQVDSRQRASTTLALAAARERSHDQDVVEGIITSEMSAFSAGMLRRAGYDAHRARSAGFSAEACREAGYDRFECKRAGYAPREVFEAGLAPQMPRYLIGSTKWPSFSECRAAEMSLAQLRAAGYFVQVPAAREGGYSSDEFRRLGVGAKGCREVGFTLVEVRAAGYSPGQCQSAGYAEIPEYVCDTALIKVRDRCVNGWPNLAALRRAGFSLKDCELFGYDAILDDARQSGYDALDFRKAGKNATDCRNAGFKAADLKAAGYSGLECKQAGYTAKELLPLCSSENGGTVSSRALASVISKASFGRSSAPTPRAVHELQPTNSSSSDGLPAGGASPNNNQDVVTIPRSNSSSNLQPNLLPPRSASTPNNFRL